MSGEGGKTHEKFWDECDILSPTPVTQKKKKGKKQKLGEGYRGGRKEGSFNISALGVIKRTGFGYRGVREPEKV